MSISKLEIEIRTEGIGTSGKEVGISWMEIGISPKEIGTSEEEIGITSSEIAISPKQIVTSCKEIGEQCLVPHRSYARPGSADSEKMAGVLRVNLSVGTD